MTAQDAIRNHLRVIYGDETGAAIMERLQPLLNPLRSGDSDALALSERDVILICYGDHVHDGDQPPLAVLHRFLKERVSETVNSVHLLPFFPYSSDDGFSVIDYYAVDPALGDWPQINAMRDDFRLMFDAVFNHISAKSDWFEQFKRGTAPYDDYFISVPPDTDLSDVVRPRALPLLTPVQTASGKQHVWTTFSDDQIDLNFANPDVLLDIIKILRFYVEQGAALIRLDAIAFLWKEVGTPSIHLEQTHRIIQVMRLVLDVIAPDVVLITETNVPHEENISYFGDGQNEAQMVYQFPLPPLILHTLTAGDSTVLTRWAASLETLSERTTFFNFTASHDGIGMRPATGLLDDEQVQALLDLAQAHGGRVSYKTNSDGSQSPYELNITYFDAITDPTITAKTPQIAVQRFMVSQAIMLALAGVPGIYFHSLFGSQNWYAGVEQTGRSRTINREKLDYDTLSAELDDPAHLRAAVFDRYEALLRIRTGEAAFHPLGTQIIHQISPEVFAVERHSRDASTRVLALHNITGREITITPPALSGAWHDLLSHTAWNGTDSMTLAPYQICWLKHDPA